MTFLPAIGAEVRIAGTSESKPVSVDLVKAIGSRFEEVVRPDLRKIFAALAEDPNLKFPQAIYTPSGRVHERPTELPYAVFAEESSAPVLQEIHLRVDGTSEDRKLVLDGRQAPDVRHHNLVRLMPCTFASLLMR